MFDIHSHIIYHIDDGSHDLEESLELIRQDVEQGAHAIIATPHYYIQYPTDPARIRAKLATIEEALGIGVQSVAQPTPGSAESAVQLRPSSTQTTDAAAVQSTPSASEANASALDVHLYAGNEVLWFDSMTERL